MAASSLQCDSDHHSTCKSEATGLSVSVCACSLHAHGSSRLFDISGGSGHACLGQGSGGLQPSVSITVCYSMICIKHTAQVQIWSQGLRRQNAKAKQQTHLKPCYQTCTHLTRPKVVCTKRSLQASSKQSQLQFFVKTPPHGK